MFQCILFNVELLLYGLVPRMWTIWSFKNFALNKRLAFMKAEC